MEFILFQDIFIEYQEVNLVVYKLQEVDAITIS